jgi:hypothetical protein
MIPPIRAPRYYSQKGERDQVQTRSDRSFLSFMMRSRCRAFRCDSSSSSSEVREGGGEAILEFQAGRSLSLNFAWIVALS